MISKFLDRFKNYIVSLEIYFIAELNETIKKLKHMKKS